MTYYSNDIDTRTVLDKSLYGATHGRGSRKFKGNGESRRGDNENVKSFFSDRVEKLRELYSEMEPEYHRICTYEDPVDGRRNSHELWEVEEGISPFELDDFEDRMPKPEDYCINPEELKEVGNELKRTLS